VIVRSKQRMMESLSIKDDDNDNGNDQSNKNQLLTVIEHSLLDMSDDEIKSQLAEANAVVSCLGHNINFSGIWGHPRRLVSEAVERLTKAMIATSVQEEEGKDTQSTKNPKKFILMVSDGVAHPLQTDDPRSFSERTILYLVRLLIPPHHDNELAAEHLVKGLGCDAKSCPSLEWSIVRPTDLVDEGSTEEYTLYPKPVYSLFGGGVSTRSNVAQCMVDLLTNEELWSEWKYQMPVLYDKKEDVQQAK